MVSAEDLGNGHARADDHLTRKFEPGLIDDFPYWLWVSDFVDPVEIEQSVGGAGSLYRCDAP
jgi:hypothetical protein